MQLPIEPAARKRLAKAMVSLSKLPADERKEILKAEREKRQQRKG